MFCCETVSEAACALKSAVRRVDGVEPTRVEESSNRQTQDGDTRYKFQMFQM